MKILGDRILIEFLDKSTISYGLNAIKNVGEKALESIIENREKEGPFKSIFDFCSRIDQQKVNKRVLESLIKSGAFDTIEKNRHKLFHSIDLMLNHSEYGCKIPWFTNIS